MKGYFVNTYVDPAQMPSLPDSNFFHSRQLMELCQQTPRHQAIMAVVTAENDVYIAHLLALVRRRKSLFPPYFYRHVSILGEGVYADQCTQHDEVFSLMLKKLTGLLLSRSQHIEVSLLSQRMFGYKMLRQEGFFPVKWSSVHNSLHSASPEERITPRLLKHIEAAEKHGIETIKATTEEDLQDFIRLLKRHNRLKPRRFIPDVAFFRGLMNSGNGSLFVTRYRHHTIGCCACVYSRNDAFLWYSAARRKSFAPLHPNAVTIWESIKDAHKSGYKHYNFMDVGLPYQHNPYREFILGFGGKEVSTFRWFRFRIGWLNKLLAWWFRE